MTRFRIILWLVFAGLIALGMAACGVSLSLGMIDQAIAFAWPSMGAAIAVALLIPAAKAE
ncbi:MAG: hypothetical protein ACK4NO_02320 [Glycocaulis sp.]